MIHRDFWERISGLDIPQRFTAKNSFTFSRRAINTFAHVTLDTPIESSPLGIRWYVLPIPWWPPPDLFGSDVGIFVAVALVPLKEPTLPVYPDLPFKEGRKTIFRIRLPHIWTRSEHIVSPLQHSTMLCPRSECPSGWRFNSPLPVLV